MASVKLTNVKKVYGKNTVAVQDFNLEIKDREFVVFVGPSGCGKSTTLRMIAGLEDISEGTVEIGGVVVNDLQPKDRGIAMVFQNYALYPNLTVFGNIAFPLDLVRVPVTEEEPKVAGEEANETPNVIEGETTVEEISEEGAGEKKKKGIFGRRQKKHTANDGKTEAEKNKPRYRKLTQDEVTERVMNVAEMLGIKEYLLRRPKELSGGQRQRVAIGRAIVRDSKVLLLDEPLSNLDAKLRNQMRAEFILLHKKINATFIYVTHDQTEAMTLGDRIVIMKDGFIQQVGTPTEVFDMPYNLFVAEFIGSPKMNTFKTRLECDRNGYYVSLCGVRMPVDGEKGEALKAKGVAAQDIVLGVRPEHVSLTKRDNPAAVPCTIRVNEMMGSELHLHVVSPQGEEIVVRVPTVSLDAKQLTLLRADVKIFITFRSKVMHFFNAETNRNLLVDDAPAEQAETAEKPDSEDVAQ